LAHQVLVTIKSATGLCFALDNSKGVACDANDPLQQWYYYPDQRSLKGVSTGRCLAIYSGDNLQGPYSWECITADPRQQWELVVGGTTHIRSAMGSCLAMNGSVFGWECLKGDFKQQWEVRPVVRVSFMWLETAVAHLTSRAPHGIDGRWIIGRTH